MGKMAGSISVAWTSAGWIATLELVGAPYRFAVSGNSESEALQAAKDLIRRASPVQVNYFNQHDIN